MNEKTIFRSVLTKNFTTLPNSFLRDERLSFKARGLAAMVLTNQEDWNVTCGWLESRTTEGREAIRSALEELREFGYATFARETDAVGKFSSCVWNFYDSAGHYLPGSGYPKDGKPSDGKPSYGKPSDGKPSPKERPSSENYSKKNDCKKDSSSESAVTKLKAAYCEAWERRFGGKYNFMGAKDGKAAQNLCGLKLSVEEVMAVATAAWQNLEEFNCKHSISLAGLASRFNEIRVAVSKPARTRGVSAAGCLPSGERVFMP